MEIKPTGLGANLPPVSNNDQPVNKTFSRQTEAASSLVQRKRATTSALGEYKKADLQDPAKVEKMLSQCTGGLLDDVLGKSKPEPFGEREFLPRRLAAKRSICSREATELSRTSTEVKWTFFSTYDRKRTIP